MAYDYDVDILAALWTGAEDGEEPYASILAANPTLTDEVAELRILSTIEALRSHMELISTRGESKLLKEAISKLITHTAGGSNPFSDEAAITSTLGNVRTPTFPAGASLEITNERDGSTACPISITGGDTATVVDELNSTLLFAGVAEMTDITITAPDVAGSISGLYFTIDDLATSYYVWFDVAARAQSASFNTFDIFGICGPPVAGVVPAPGMDNSTLSRGVGDAIVVDDPGIGPHYFWFAIAGDPELTSITYPAASVFTRSTTPGAPSAGDYWTFEEALDGGANTPYYVWYNVSPSPEFFDVTCPADVAGSLNGTHWTLEDAPTTTKEHYVWYCVSRPESLTIDWTGITGASLPTGVTPAASFDVTSTSATYRFWFDDGSTTAPAVTTETLVSIAFTGAEADQAISDLVVAALIGADADFAGAANGGGTTPLVSLTLATDGNVTDTADGVVATGAVFTVTVQGITAAADPAPGGTGLKVSLSGDEADTAVATATSAIVGASPAFSASPAGAVVSVSTATPGAVVDAADVDAGVGVVVTTQGSDANTDPAPGGTGIMVAVIGSDIDSVVQSATAGAITGGSSMTITGAAGAVHVLNGPVGAAADTADVTASLVTVTKTQEGVDTSTDPGLPGTSVPVPLPSPTASIPPNDVIISGFLGPAVSGAGFSFSPFLVIPGLTGCFTITNPTPGVPGGPPALVGPSWGAIGALAGVSVAGIDASVDPAPGGTGVPVPLGGDASIPTIVSGVAGALGGLGGTPFLVASASPVVTTTITATGPAPDATTGTAGAFLTTVVTADGAASGVIGIEAFRDVNGAIGFRVLPGFEQCSFSLANGAGGIIGPGGLIPGERPGTIVKVSREGRDRAANHVAKTRTASLT